MFDRKDLEGHLERMGFMDVKLAPTGAKLSSPPSSVSVKGKGKVKLEKNVADE